MTPADHKSATMILASYPELSPEQLKACFQLAGPEVEKAVTEVVATLTGDMLDTVRGFQEAAATGKEVELPSGSTVRIRSPARE